MSPTCRSVRTPAASRKHGLRKRPLRVASFLAPNMFPVYHFISRWIAAKLGCALEFFSGSCYQQLATEVDAAFVCGLAYVELSRSPAFHLEPLVAPVLHGERYGSRPIYFSDVI